MCNSSVIRTPWRSIRFYVRRAREFAQTRLFPDQIVCYGVASVFIPYTDPGLKLAQAIHRETEEFMRVYEQRPAVIHLENHGLITLGKTPQAIMTIFTPI